MRCWITAFVSADFLVALCFAVVAMTLSQLVPQRKAHPPTFAGGAGSPLLNHTEPSREIVPTSALVAICVCVPLAIQVMISHFEQKGIPSRLYSYMYAVACTATVVDCAKRYCGYWRPYYYDHRDYRSFPSGHSALSAAALGHAALCCLGAAKTGEKKVPKAFKANGVDLGSPILILSLAPAFLALWIAATRVREADHHPADIVGGSTIGFAFASLFYFRYFPHIFHPESHLPRPSFADDQNSDSTTDSSNPLAELVVDT